MALKEDTKVQVTGTVGASPVIEVERKSRDLDPQIKAKLEAVNVFIAADDIRSI